MIRGKAYYKNRLISKIAPEKPIKTKIGCGDRKLEL
jgi:hypothetical protein